MYLGNGDGTFQSPVGSPGGAEVPFQLPWASLIATPSRIWRWAMAPLGNANGGVGRVLLGNGNGTFRSGGTFSGANGAGDSLWMISMETRSQICSLVPELVSVS